MSAGAGWSTVAVVDSHRLTRECIADTVSRFVLNQSVFSFCSVSDCNERQASRFSLIILYLRALEDEALDLIKSLRAAHRRAILFLISELEYQTHPDFIRSAWRLGVRGFISAKTTSLTLAVSAICFVQAGGYFAPVESVVPRPPKPPKRAPSPSAASELTARETVVLGFLKQGKSNKAIAGELRLSNNTVKVHVHNILRKLRAFNRMEAASRGPGPIAERAAPD
jgi:DNA-binding NarL/FixJ family response regulator